MAGRGTQVNVRLSADDLDVLDALRRSASGEMSRAEFLRFLLRARSRAATDMRIAEAYDAARPADDALAEGSAIVSGEALRDL